MLERSGSVFMVMVVVITSVRVSMSMMSVAEGSHTNQIHHQTKTTDGQ